MKEKTALTRSAAKWFTVSMGAAAGAYATYVAITWWRYGRAGRPAQQDHDPLLDRFMPVYDIAERHHIRVAAPPPVRRAAARDLDLFQRLLVRAIFKARDLVLGAVHRRSATTAWNAGRSAVAWVGGARRSSGSRDCRWRRHQTLGSECHIPTHSWYRIRSVSGTQLHQNRLGATRRCGSPASPAI